MATGTIKSVQTVELVVVEHTVSSDIDLNSTSYVEKTATITKEGYTPVGIVGNHFENGSGGSGSSYLYPYRLYLDDIQSGSATVKSMIRNGYSSNATNVEFYVEVLWKKVG